VRSLFAKILLWFLATVLFAFVGFSVTAARHYNDPMRQAPMSRAIRFQSREAVEAYEAGGVPALRWDLARVQEIFQSEAILADAKGRDLVTGEDRSDLIAAGSVRPFIPRDRSVVAHKTANGRYWFILSIPGEPVSGRNFPIGQLYVLGAVVLLCYLLAWYLRPALDPPGEMSWASLPALSTRWPSGFKTWLAPSAGFCWISRTNCDRPWPGWASRSSWRVPERIAMRRSIAYKRNPTG
jgi:hypothetical protein